MSAKARSRELEMIRAAKMREAERFKRQRDAHHTLRRLPRSPGA